MANLNKVMLIGRLTRDPEPIQLGGSTAGAKFGFAVNNRKQNKDTKEWEDVPVFIDMEIWNRGESKQADRVLSTLRKGQQVFIEGHLKLDTWDDKNGGGKRSALRVVVELFQYLEPRQDGEGGGFRSAPSRQPARAGAGAGGGRPSGGYDGGDDYGEEPAPRRSGKPAPTDEDIPF